MRFIFSFFRFVQKTYSNEAGHIELESKIFKILTDKLQGWIEDVSLEAQISQLFQFVDYMNHELDTYVDLIILGQPA